MTHDALDGKVRNEGAALSRLTLDTQGGIVAAQHMFDDGQTEAGAAADLLGRVERLEDPADRLLRDPRSGVGHDDRLSTIRFRARRHGDGAAARRELDRIVHQVGDHLLHPLLIGEDPLYRERIWQTLKERQRLNLAVLGDRVYVLVDGALYEFDARRPDARQALVAAPGRSAVPGRRRKAALPGHGQRHGRTQ